MKKLFSIALIALFALSALASADSIGDYPTYGEYSSMSTDEFINEFMLARQELSMRRNYDPESFGIYEAYLLYSEMYSIYQDAAFPSLIHHDKQTDGKAGVSNEWYFEDEGISLYVNYPEGDIDKFMPNYVIQRQYSKMNDDYEIAGLLARIMGYEESEVTAELENSLMKIGDDSYIASCEVDKDYSYRSSWFVFTSKKIDKETYLLSCRFSKYGD